MATLTAIAMSACRARVDQEMSGSADPVEELLLESDRVWGSFQLGGLIYIGLVVATAATLAWLVSRGVDLAWRAGFDHGRRLGPLRTGLRATIGFFAVLIIVRHLVAQAPLVSLGVLALCAVVMAVAMAQEIRSAMVGIGLVVRRVLHEGDRVDIGDDTGVVHRVGLARVELRRADGSIVLVPNKVIADRPLRIAAVRNTVPLSVEIAIPRVPTAVELEHARRLSLLLPLRASGTPTSAKLIDEGRALRVELEITSDRMASATERQLRRQLTAMFAADAAPPSKKK